MLIAWIVPFFLIFCRIGTALMVLPGFGAGSMPIQIRLLLALLVAGVLLAPMRASLPADLGNMTYMLQLIAFEICIGFFIGTIGRVLLSAMDNAGIIISYHMGLSAAQMFNPQFGASGSLVGVFLSTVAMTLIFVTDLHHMILMALANSYTVFPTGDALPVSGMGQVMSRLVADSFIIGAQIAAPFIFGGLIFYLGLGLLARLMPQMQVFFVAMPAQILLGLVVMTLGLSAGMMFWLSRFQETYSSLVGG